MHEEISAYVEIGLTVFKMNFSVIFQRYYNIHAVNILIRLFKSIMGVRIPTSIFFLNAGTVDLRVRPCLVEIVTTYPTSTI